VKPDRVVHHLTPAGRAELERWLSEPSTRLRGYRDDFFLKLMAAVQSGDRETLDGVLRRQRAHLLREMHSLAEARRQAPTAVIELLITAAELHIRADLGVVDAAEKSLEPELAGARRNSSNAQRPGTAAPHTEGTPRSASGRTTAAG
jgi:DNA-binding PadR family transcriptional regulator